MSFKLCGIICEYNPFHAGHAWHIDETRRILGEETTIVAVMSGDYTQRGEPAVFKTRARAAAALEKADIVLEMPLFAAVASAEVFAGGGVAVLDAIGASGLSFGSESGDSDVLREIADCLLTPEFVFALKPELEKGVSFAVARQRAVRNLIGEKANALSDPNDILAIEYLKAIRYSGADITPLSIKRIGPGHDAATENSGLKSASALREMLLKNEDVSDYVPAGAMDIYREEMASVRGPVSFLAAEQSLFYRLRTMSLEDYARLPYASEGLHLKLKKAALDCETIPELIAKVKTKRYPESGIRRMLLYAWLGADFRDARINYIRVLGFNDRGRQALKEIAKTCPVPLLTKPASVRQLSDAAVGEFEFRAGAASIYALMWPGGGRYNVWEETPIYKSVL